MPNPEIQDFAIPEADLARRINASSAVLRKWRREGKGPEFVRIGRLIRYPIRGVNAWLAAHTVKRPNL